MIKAIEEIQQRFLAEVEKIKDLASLERARLDFLGKKGSLTAILKQMGRLLPEQRKAVGQKANQIRTQIEASIEEIKKRLEEEKLAAQLAEETIDISWSREQLKLGSMHPIHLVMQELTELFVGMGYTLAEGPEIEYDRYNFDLLRLPPEHPARDSQDTFYLAPHVLLRSQTSPVQIRVMEEQKPPIKIICPGRVFRSDTPDATHSPVFYQIEGLVVDQNVQMSDLIGTLQIMARHLFGKDTKIRLRPHHFPFTEPSCEVDLSCWTCKGQKDDCSTCHGEHWVELLGAGMVHPEVLDNCGIDSKVYSGFAFGIGLERATMARFGIKDIRLFYDNDLRFLEQFQAVEER